MISNKTTYDAVLKSLNPDTPKTLYIPELQRYAEVVFTADNLYIADHSTGEKMWHPVHRDTSNATPFPLPTLHKLPEKMAVGPVPYGNPGNQTPPPPYTVNANWPTQNPGIAEQATPIALPSDLPPTRKTVEIATQHFVQTNGPKNTADSGVINHAAGLPARRKRNAKGKKVQRVDPQTGASVSADTPNAIPKATFDHRRSVHPITGAVVAEGTPGAVPRYFFYNHKRVDPVTGKSAAIGATDTVSSNVFNKRKLVHKLTGEPIDPNSPNAVPRSVYLLSKPVHPLTGESVAADFPGAITIGSYRRRKAKGKIPQ